MKIYNKMEIIIIDDEGFGVKILREIVEIAFGPVDTMAPISRNLRSAGVVRSMVKGENSPLRQPRSEASPAYEAIFLHDITKNIEENVEIYKAEIAKETEAREQAENKKEAREKSVAAANARQAADDAIEAARLAEEAADDALCVVEGDALPDDGEEPEGLNNLDGLPTVPPLDDDENAEEGTGAPDNSDIEE